MRYRPLKPVPLGKWKGRLTIISGPQNKNTTPRDPRQSYKCKCDCGVIKTITFSSLKKGTSSCGCLMRERASATAKITFTTHGETTGRTSSAEYRIWSKMISRCHNPSDTGYYLYGERGIAVCNQWRNSLPTFLSDMGRRPSLQHSLDRYPDNNGNYEPGNVRWATPKEQARNRRTNTFLEHNGRRLTISGWAEELGWPKHILHHRIRAGWTVDKMLTTPPLWTWGAWAKK